MARQYTVVVGRGAPEVIELLHGRHERAINHVIWQTRREEVWAVKRTAGRHHAEHGGRGCTHCSTRCGRDVEAHGTDRREHGSDCEDNGHGHPFVRDGCLMTNEGV